MSRNAEAVRATAGYMPIRRSSNHQTRPEGAYRREKDGSLTPRSLNQNHFMPFLY